MLTMTIPLCRRDRFRFRTIAYPSFWFYKKAYVCDR